MIKGRQKSILCFFNLGAQLCGHIPQSTNLQEEKPRVKLNDVQLFTYMSLFCTFLSKTDAVTAEIQPSSGWVQAWGRSPHTLHLGPESLL